MILMKKDNNYIKIMKKIKKLQKMILNKKWHQNHKDQKN